ncbi:MAG: alkaline phosphatase family protein [Planctomycetota bacterium]|nr:MAG: alkaline phosphatase family protein [Planctomycetota bacterium]
MNRYLLLNVVGLTESLMQSGAMPQLQAFAEKRAVRRLQPDLPAVTLTSQASMLTGKAPSDHGIVGNGWYFRNLAEVWLWRQSCHLLQASTILERWRQERPDDASANLFWWFNLPSQADLSLTPRPTYWADGRKGPDVHSGPPALGRELQAKLGDFPLFQFWGPGAAIASSRWIADAAVEVLQSRQPGLCLVYLPHLDYDLQRFGPSGPEAARAAAELDVELAKLLQQGLSQGFEILVVSEYGITPVKAAVYPNQALRRGGWLQVHPARNGALLDPGHSRAFAVCDHQCAHVYVADPHDLEPVRKCLQELPGVAEIYGSAELEKLGLNHVRTGELFLVADRDHWFAYPYWSEQDQEPDFARTVDIHRKPGYDPCELFLDPSQPGLKLKLGLKLLGKKLGFRTLFNPVPLDTSLVRGSHGRLPEQPEHGPIWIGPEALAPIDRASLREAFRFLL